MCVTPFALQKKYTCTNFHSFHLAFVQMCSSTCLFCKYSLNASVAEWLLLCCYDISYCCNVTISGFRRRGCGNHTHLRIFMALIWLVVTTIFLAAFDHFVFAIHYWLKILNEHKQTWRLKRVFVSIIYHNLKRILFLSLTLL